MIQLLLVEDHQIVLDGLRGLVNYEPNLEIAAEALTGKEALQKLAQTNIDVVLLDINLPDLSGFEVFREIRKTHPAVKVIALTMHDEGGYISRLAKMGIDGYLLKNTGQEEMMQAIKTVTAGGRYFSEEVKQRLLSISRGRPANTSDFIQKLTRRESEVLRLIVDELTTDEIAQKLFISPTTVISHRKSLLRKLNAKNTAGLVRAAFEFGLLKEG